MTKFIIASLCILVTATSLHSCKNVVIAATVKKFTFSMNGIEYDISKGTNGIGSSGGISPDGTGRMLESYLAKDGVSLTIGFGPIVASNSSDGITYDDVEYFFAKGDYNVDGNEVNNFSTTHNCVIAFSESNGDLYTNSKIQPNTSYCYLEKVVVAPLKKRSSNRYFSYKIAGTFDVYLWNIYDAQDSIRLSDGTFKFNGSERSGL